MILIGWVCISVASFLMVVACAAKRFGVEMYGQVLRLEMTLDKQAARPGDDLVARELLTNVSAHRVEGCLGESKGYNIVGTKDARGMVNVVDHPGCVRRFVLEPGQSLALSETLKVIDVGEGAARANVWVQVTDPTECDRYGCDAISVASPLMPFQILPAR